MSTVAAGATWGVTETLLLVLLAPLLLVSALFSGSETSLFGLGTRQRLDLERRNALADRTALSLLKHPRQLLITILVGNMAANVCWFTIVAVLAGSQPWGLGGAAAVQVAGVLVIVLAGEVIPKVMASADPVRTARRIAMPLRAVHLVLLPVRTTIERWAVRPLSRLAGNRPDAATVSEDDLDALLDQSTAAGVVDRWEHVHLEGVLQLGRLPVKKVMTPRTRMTMLGSDDTSDEIADAFRSSGLSRLPVHDGDPDTIIGQLPARAWLHAGRPADITALLLPPVFVPSVAATERVLETLRESGRKTAIVVDEYGGTAGVVSMRDLVEPLTGSFDPARLAPAGEVGT
ncbi:MAG: CNNM domain-containing protein [Phycisphaerales bacterium]|nr:CNNM domain-containing protein [Phycisphaerales bacterium]